MRSFFKLTRSLFTINHSNANEEIVSAAITVYFREGSVNNMVVSPANNAKCN